MKPLFILLVLSLSFVCEGQTKMEDIDYKDIVEIKGLVCLKKDTSLVSGKVIRYNKKNEAKRYILVSKGKPDNEGWIQINDNYEMPKESELGDVLLAGAFITGAALAITGNDIDVPISSNKRYNGNVNDYIDEQKDYNKKAHNDMSDRNDISKNLNSVKEKSNGPFEEYYEDGQLEIKGNYIDEKKTGTWEEYYDNGQMRSQGNYINGSKKDEWKTYYKNGQLEEIGNYLNGKTINWRQRDELNKLRVNNNSNMEFKTEEWKTLDESGVMRIENNLDEKKVTESGFDKKKYNVREYRIGEWKAYHENGQLKEIGYYSGKGYFNNKTGEWKYYDETGKLLKKENFD